MYGMSKCSHAPSATLSAIMTAKSGSHSRFASSKLVRYPAHTIAALQLSMPNSVSGATLQSGSFAQISSAKIRERAVNRPPGKRTVAPLASLKLFLDPNPAAVTEIAASALRLLMRMTRSTLSIAPPSGLASYTSKPQRNNAAARYVLQSLANCAPSNRAPKNGIIGVVPHAPSLYSASVISFISDNICGVRRKSTYQAYYLIPCNLQGIKEKGLT